MVEIVIASFNLHKIRECKDILKCFKHIELISLHQIPNYQAPDEKGSNFQENAILKAEHAARHFQKWVLADDSGLVVPALKGEPGVYSRRYAGSDASNAENRKKLLDAMQHLISREERSAYYECALALASPAGLKKCVTGICEGFILHEERGRNGFGYDSVFVKNDYDKTFGEIEESTKNRISHRRKAFERLSTTLEMTK